MQEVNNTNMSAFFIKSSIDKELLEPILNNNFVYFGAFVGTPQQHLIVHILNEMYLNKNIPIGYLCFTNTTKNIFKYLLISKYTHYIQREYCYSNEEMLNNKLKQVKENPFYVEDAKHFSLEKFKQTCIFLAKEKKVKIIAIDDVELIEKRFGKTWAKELKQLTETLNITFILRESLHLQNIKLGLITPKITDFKYLKSLEINAVNCVLSHRPEYYKGEYWQDGTPCKDEIKLITYVQGKKQAEQKVSTHLSSIGYLSKYFLI